MNAAAFESYLRDCRADGLSDHEIALILSGMKLAFTAATKLSGKQNREAAGIAFVYQQECDPKALTWEK